MCKEVRTKQTIRALNPETVTQSLTQHNSSLDQGEDEEDGGSTFALILKQLVSTAKKVGTGLASRIPNHDSQTPKIPPPSPESQILDHRNCGMWNVESKPSQMACLRPKP
jgi:hypothetical protein